MTKKNPTANLLSLWDESIAHAHHTIGAAVRSELQEAGAALFLGKMAGFFAEHVPAHLRSRSFGVGFSPRNAHAFWEWIESEHPFPGKKSFYAGETLVRYFEFLRAENIQSLKIFISGGTSSMLWLPISPAREFQGDLQKKLRGLYRKNLNIFELNAQRSKFCGLKLGGATRILNLIAPKVRAHVIGVSDVEPWSALAEKILGSGPFYGLPCRLIFGNQEWRIHLEQSLAKFNIEIIQNGWKSSNNFHRRVNDHVREIKDLVKRKISGALIYGCEPSLKLPARAGRGGRMSHLALALALKCSSELKAGKIRILAASSDGVDGNSGLAALEVREPPDFVSGSLALKRFDSGSFFLRHQPAGCIRSRPTGLNVQDLLMVLVGK